MVSADPQPLPMSPGAAAAAGVPGTAAVVAIAGASSVHLPEKSVAGCAASDAQNTAANDVTRNVRIIDSLLLLRRHIRIRRIRRHMRIALGRRDELVVDAIGDALHPWIRVLHVGFFLGIRQQVEE